MIKLWLDDDPERDPAGDWVIVRKADEAIKILKSGNVVLASLDHDLGDIRQEPYPFEITGMDVVKWMIKENVFPSVINIHSFNPRARAMVEDLMRAGANSNILMWRWEGGLAKELEEALKEMGE